MGQLNLVIGNKNYSTWSLRPWFFLTQLGIPFTETLVYLSQEDTSEKLSAYFSNQKVPVLFDGDLQVWDTLAIMEYIADKHPEKSSWPAQLESRAKARAVSAEMHASFMDLRGALPMNIRKHYPNYPITPAVQKDIDRIQTLWAFCRENKVSDGDWLFGDFSIADAMFAPVVMRFIGYDVKLKPAAASYVEFVHQSPTMQLWIEQSKSETQIIPEDEV